jgi:uncharacterized membrane protein YdbT with pleckstrin-like domain
MPYPAKLLNPDESVALDLHPHWWYFAESVSSFTVSGILWLFVFGKYQDDPKPFLTYPIGVIALATLVWVIVRYLKWRTTYFVITSDRLIYRNGVIGKAGIEIPLERVNNVNFKQGIFERIIGAGDLLIESGGEDGQQRFTDIAHPDKVQNLIHMQMEDNQNIWRLILSRPNANRVDESVKLEMQSLSGVWEKARTTGSPGRWG